MSKQITLDELSKHNKPNDAWIAIDGNVFDVTDYISKHPGGVNTISKGLGKDATAMFMQAHSYVKPNVVLPGKQVGVLKK